MHKHILAIVLCLTTTLTLGMPFVDGDRGSVAHGQTPGQKPIKIGFLAPLTGPFTDSGKDMELGARLALRSLGNKIAGRPVELLVQDTAATPDVGLSKARQLVEQSRVHLLMGVLHGGVAMAVAFFAKEKKVPLVISGGGGATQVMYELKPQPYVFRASESIKAMEIPLGFYGASVLGYRRAVAMSWDYVAGRDALDGFAIGFEAGGGKVIRKIFFKLGTPDFSPYLTSIPRDADVVNVHLSGADAVRFIKQYAELGYKDKLPLLAFSLGVSDRILPQLGDAALGIVSNTIYAVNLPTPGNSVFAPAYVREAGMEPGTEAALSYSSMLAVAKAIEAIGGAVDDVPRLLNALKNTSVQDSIRGPFSFNSMNDIVSTVWITKVVKQNGVLRHQILNTYTNVDAGWMPRK